MSNAEFLADIERNLAGLQFFSVGWSEACPECPEDPECDGEEFSSRSCDSCGSGLGGSRHSAHADIDGELVHLKVCVDCLMYHANGELPFDD